MARIEERVDERLDERLDEQVVYRHVGTALTLEQPGHTAVATFDRPACWTRAGAPS